jgi:hypothetical protein
MLRTTAAAALALPAVPTEPAPARGDCESLLRQEHRRNPEDRPQNDPHFERAIFTLADFADAAEDLFLDHGIDCDCTPCADVYGCLYTVEIFHSLLGCEA